MNKCILIIEPDEYDRKELASILSQDGHYILEASDENEAFEIVFGMCANNQIDYIIDFSFFLRQDVMNILIRLCNVKFKNRPSLISDNFQLGHLEECEFRLNGSDQ
jgi:hypothetical protein